ncbi:MAG TPA: FAD-dependent monooxygenase [Terriglobia bacterium]|nr:FAD-dependent monooxygenase [Terriglobia bacterium]
MGLAQKSDVIVVGAGPAGSTAAKLLADRGYHVFLIDRATFPRHKTCASWINRLAFERFPYLLSRLDELIEAPFYGVTFYDRALGCEGRFGEAQPSGYLSLRSKFDDSLRRIAVKAGVEFLGGRGVVNLDEGRDEIRVRLADGKEFAARVVVGADGASSRVAVAAGLRKGWRRLGITCFAPTPTFPARASAFAPCTASNSRSGSASNTTEFRATDGSFPSAATSVSASAGVWRITAGFAVSIRNSSVNSRNAAICRPSCATKGPRSISIRWAPFTTFPV